MTIVVTLLPEPLPSREDEATFADRADAVMAQFNETLTQMNSQNDENNDIMLAVANLHDAMELMTDAVLANAANINTVSSNIASVNAVAAIAAAVAAVAAIAANVTTVAGNTANINAAVADIPSLAAKVSKTGDTMTGHLVVPAGATGSQAPRATDVKNHTFPTGTKMLFIQTAAPTGWTKDTTHNNKALRVVSGAAGSGGTVAFTTAFASTAVAGSVGSTVLTEAQMPSHNHVINTVWSDGGVNIDGGMFAKVNGANQVNSPRTVANTGGSAGHNHSFTGTAIDLAVQYVDTIIATKD